MKFLVFEGLDGCGKSTLIHNFSKYLDQCGESYLITREPGSTPLGEDLRHLILRTDGEAPTPRAEALLYQAARAQHVDKVIVPALKKGLWVLCDRFTASSVAFQGNARDLGKESIDWLNAFSTHNLQADLTILIDLQVKESLKRIANRASEKGEVIDRMELEAQEFHIKVKASFDQQAKEQAERWLVLDGQETPETITQKLIEEIGRRQWLRS